jgi:hypothetical protein
MSIYVVFGTLVAITLCRIKPNQSLIFKVPMMPKRPVNSTTAQVFYIEFPIPPALHTGLSLSELSTIPHAPLLADPHETTF